MFRKLSVAIGVAGVFFLGFLAGANQNQPEAAQTQKPKGLELVRRVTADLAAERIVGHLAFESGEKKFTAIVQSVDEPPVEDSLFKQADKLTIYDESGNSVFDFKDLSIGDLGMERLVRSDSWELTFSSNGGGTDSFLHILKYEEGRFVELGEPDDLQYRGGYLSMPQYRTGVSGPYFKPSQLIVIQQIAGTDVNPSATVLRSEKGKFGRVGEIRMQELGDFIEKSIARNRKQSSN